MEKNRNKLISKTKEFLGLILFSIIYFFFQQRIYPALAFLFWLVFMGALGGIAFNILTFLNLSNWINIIGIILSGIALIMALGFIFYLGYFCSGFLKKINKTMLGSVMIAILIYFLYKIFTETDENTTMFSPSLRESHIFSATSHIFYTIGVFFSNKVKKILDRIKFKRKNK